MAWNNKQQWGGPKGGWNNNSNNNQRSNNNRPLKAHSGCEYRNHTKNGEAKEFVFGWKVSKRFGMVKLMAGPFKGEKNKTKEFISKRTGQKYYTWKVKITNEQGATNWHSCLFYPATCNVIIPDMGWCMVPKARRKETNGRGYIGKFGDKK